jgi:GTP-binding protein
MSPAPLKSTKPYRRSPSGARGDRTGHKGPRQKQNRGRPRGRDTLERDPSARPPCIAIVGRPNVGKSTLLNALGRSLVSIVDPTPGVTRDRVSMICTLADRTVEVVDTGGIGIVDAQGLAPYVEAQVDEAIRRADVIVFLVDAKEGIVPLDHAVATRLRVATSRVVLAANKAESDRVVWNVGEMAALGFGDPVSISAKEGYRLRQLELRIAALLPAGPTTPVKIPPPAMQLAIVGRVNVGKSSIVNALVHEDRMIVSEVPGTTRDSVDVRFEKDGEAFVLIDTAGIRKEKAVQNSLEFYAQRRSERAMRRADVTALILDAVTDIARLDKEIAGEAVKERHPILLVVNKWDLAPAGFEAKDYVEYLRKILPALSYAPILFVSAHSGRNLGKIVETARSLHRQAMTRVSTADVNKAIRAAYALRRPRPRQARVGKIFYGTQVDIAPPTLVMFCDDPAQFDDAYRRYLENQFRESLPFPDVPLKVVFRMRERSPSKNQLGPKPE